MDFFDDEIKQYLNEIADKYKDKPQHHVTNNQQIAIATILILLLVGGLLWQKSIINKQQQAILQLQTNRQTVVSFNHRSNVDIFSPVPNLIIPPSFNEWKQCLNDSCVSEQPPALSL